MERHHLRILDGRNSGGAKCVLLLTAFRDARADHPSVQAVPRVCSDRPLVAVSSSVCSRVLVFSLDGALPFLTLDRSQTDPYHPGRLFAESNKPISPLVRPLAPFPLDSTDLASALAAARTIRSSSRPDSSTRRRLTLDIRFLRFFRLACTTAFPRHTFIPRPRTQHHSTLSPASLVLV